MIDIIFEDDNLIAINKPSGMLVHGDGHTCEESLADFLIDTGKVTKAVGEPLVIPLGKGVVADCALPSHEYVLPGHGASRNGAAGELRIYRPGIVHRLDKDTSGVMVIAKNNETFYMLKTHFQDRTMKKEYTAIVRGKFKKNIGSISVPIGRSKNDFRKWLGENSAGRATRGELRDAVTDYRVLRSFRTDDGTEWSVILVKPRTGRTHQIRVHMKHVNHPVGGDKLYGDERTAAAFPRLMLHALRLSFAGKDGATRVFEAPLPEEFEITPNA